MLKFISSIDFLSPFESIRFTRNSRFQSFFGGFISLIVILFSLAMTFYISSEIFFKSQPRTINSLQIVQDLTNYYFSNKAIQMFFTIKFKNSSAFIDDSIFRVRALQSETFNHISENGIESTTYEQEILLEKCSNLYSQEDLVDFNIKFPLDKYFCLVPQKYKLNGYPGAKVFTSVKIYIDKCTNITNFNEINPQKLQSSSIISQNSLDFNSTYTNLEKKSIKKCRSKEDINSYLDGGFINILHSDYIINEQDYETPLKLYLRDISEIISNDAHSVNYLVYYNKLIFRNDKGLIFEDWKDSDVVKYNNMKTSYNFKDSDNLAYIQFEMMNFENNFRRSYPKIQDVLTKVGGFINSINIIGYLIVIDLIAQNHLHAFNYMLKKTNLNEFSNYVISSNLNRLYSPSDSLFNGKHEENLNYFELKEKNSENNIEFQENHNPKNDDIFSEEKNNSDKIKNQSEFNSGKFENLKKLPFTQINGKVSIGKITINGELINIPNKNKQKLNCDFINNQNLISEEEKKIENKDYFFTTNEKFIKVNNHGLEKDESKENLIKNDVFEQGNTKNYKIKTNFENDNREIKKGNSRKLIPERIPTILEEVKEYKLQYRSDKYSDKLKNLNISEEKSELKNLSNNNWISCKNSKSSIEDKNLKNNIIPKPKILKNLNYFANENHSESGYSKNMKNVDFDISSNSDIILRSKGKIIKEAKNQKNSIKNNFLEVNINPEYENDIKFNNFFKIKKENKNENNNIEENKLNHLITENNDKNKDENFFIINNSLKNFKDGDKNENFNGNTNIKSLNIKNFNCIINNPKMSKGKTKKILKFDPKRTLNFNSEKLNLNMKYNLCLTYWCNTKNRKMQKFLLNKEDLMNHFLSVENLSKISFDVKFLKFLYLDKEKINLIDKLYENLIIDNDQILKFKCFLLQDRFDIIGGNESHSSFGEYEEAFFNSNEREKILFFKKLLKLD